jgi:hypothetical protein
MRLVIGVITLVLLAFLLAEFFIVFLLPRRVRRDPAIARGILRVLWIPWRVGAGLLPRRAAFFSATSPGTPTGGASKTLRILEAATGLGFLAIAIGYLPALFQAFSRRETASRGWIPAPHRRPAPAGCCGARGSAAGGRSSTSTCSSGRPGRPI